MLSLFHYLWAPPWAWFSDPRWMVIGNLLFWPAYFVYLVVADRWEILQRRRRWQRKQRHA